MVVMLLVTGAGVPAARPRVDDRVVVAVGRDRAGRVHRGAARGVAGLAVQRVPAQGAVDRCIKLVLGGMVWGVNLLSGCFEVKDFGNIVFFMIDNFWNKSNAHGIDSVIRQIANAISYRGSSSVLDVI